MKFFQILCFSLLFSGLVFLGSCGEDCSVEPAPTYSFDSVQFGASNLWKVHVRNSDLSLDFGNSFTVIRTLTVNDVPLDPETFPIAEHEESFIVKAEDSEYKLTDLVFLFPPSNPKNYSFEDVVRLRITCLDRVSGDTLMVEESLPLFDRRQQVFYLRDSIEITDNGSTYKHYPSRYWGDLGNYSFLYLNNKENFGEIGELYRFNGYTLYQLADKQEQYRSGLRMLVTFYDTFIEFEEFVSSSDG